MYQLVTYTQDGAFLEPFTCSSIGLLLLLVVYHMLFNEWKRLEIRYKTSGNVALLLTRNPRTKQWIFGELPNE